MRALNWSINELNWKYEKTRESLLSLSAEATDCPYEKFTLESDQNNAYLHRMTGTKNGNKLGGCFDLPKWPQKATQKVLFSPSGSIWVFFPKGTKRTQMATQKVLLGLFGSPFGNVEIYPQTVRKKCTTFSSKQIVALRSVNKIFPESYDFAANIFPDSYSVILCGEKCENI
jgi:hypothetical protein